MKFTVLLLVLVCWLAGVEWFASVGAEGIAVEEKPPLPLSEVVLYTSGVGYFERNAQVDGNTQVELRFKTEDINDLLKSLVVQDYSGGSVSSVTYASRDPVEKALKTFGIDLTDDPGLAQILAQMRGQQIEVMTTKPLTGTILGVEVKKLLAGMADNKTVNVEFLNLLTDEGLRSIQFDQIHNVKLLNSRIDGELRQALTVLAAGHDTQKKVVTIRFNGQGKRKVSVSYIVGTPVWKTSYRLVLDEKEAPFLQGWAIVENTSDDDWNNVSLSLVSGRPISFTMDLYQSLYVTRPIIEPELYASLRPQVYGQAMEMAGVGVRSESGISMAASLEGAMGAAPSSRSLAASRAVRTKGMDLTQGVNGAAEGLQSGELFQYSIKSPVSLARQKSAMLPIISQKIEGQKVSIYNESVQSKNPLNGFRVKNTTPLYLMQGPITVFDDSAYAGDARIDDLAPKQDTLISYALDQKVEVEPQAQGGRKDLVSVKLNRGTLISTHKGTEAKVYAVRNRDQKKRDLVIEHPLRDDWTLVEPSEASERTRQYYRFAVPVAPDKTARLLVREEKKYDERVALMNVSYDKIAYYVQAPQVSEKVKKALQHIVQLQEKLGEISGKRAQLEQTVTEIGQEQVRIRENMGKLSQTSELYVRYVKKFDQQESELEDLRGKIKNQRDLEVGQHRELNEYVGGLEVD